MPPVALTGVKEYGPLKESKIKLGLLTVNIGGVGGLTYKLNEPVLIALIESVTVTL